jgi:hypothetical protein
MLEHLFESVSDLPPVEYPRPACLAVCRRRCWRGWKRVSHGEITGATSRNSTDFAACSGARRTEQCNSSAGTSKTSARRFPSWYAPALDRPVRLVSRDDHMPRQSLSSCGVGPGMATSVRPERARVPVSPLRSASPSRRVGDPSARVHPPDHREMLRYAQRAERLGFDPVWVPDHFYYEWPHGVLEPHHEACP